MADDASGTRLPGGRVVSVDADRSKAVRRIVKALQRAPVTHFKAKDILRAAGLPLLPLDNAHVSADLAAVGVGNRCRPA